MIDSRIRRLKRGKILKMLEETRRGEFFSYNPDYLNFAIQTPFYKSRVIIIRRIYFLRIPMNKVPFLTLSIFLVYPVQFTR